VAFELAKRRTRRDFVHFLRDFNTLRTRVRSAVISNYQATPVAALEQTVSGHSVTTKKETAPFRARSLILW